jgi:hypothetical protein
MEDREPVAKEKDITPIIMRMMQRIFSDILTADISPYPTVKIVVVVK